MTAEEYLKEYQLLELEFKQKVCAIGTAYVNATSPYKVGDIFTDGRGAILIDRVTGTLGSTYAELPSILYHGTVVYNDGLGHEKRYAFLKDEKK